jgi:hypothetical protein
VFEAGWSGVFSCSGVSFDSRAWLRPTESCSDLGLSDLAVSMAVCKARLWLSAMDDVLAPRELSIWTVDL